jgi:tagatose 6-phosphate kinase
MITTVTLNPMLDKTVRVDMLERGKIHRALAMDLVVGGKGVNVSRELRVLGEETLATGFLGGAVGEMLERLLDREGIPRDFVRVEGLTREGVTYLEHDGTWTAVFEPPHQVSEVEAETLVARCSRLLGQSSWIVCSGSSPSQEADGIYEAVIHRARELGVPSVLDSYGDAFLRALNAGPTLVQCNRDELSRTLHLSLENEADIRRALEGLLTRGAAYAVLTDGSGTAYATMGELFWKITPPSLTAVNPTGSGDTMIATMLARLLDDAPFEEALQFGVAAGAANAVHWEVASVTEEEIRRFLPQVALDKM